MNEQHLMETWVCLEKASETAEIKRLVEPELLS